MPGRPRGESRPDLVQALQVLGRERGLSDRAISRLLSISPSTLSRALGGKRFSARLARNVERLMSGARETSVPPTEAVRILRKLILDAQRLEALLAQNGFGDPPSGD